MRDAFQDSENRVRAIALVHETVHQARDAASVDLRGYIESIGRAVVRTNAVAGSIALDVEVPELHAGLDAAIVHAARIMPLNKIPEEQKQVYDLVKSISPINVVKLKDFNVK